MRQGDGGRSWRRREREERRRREAGRRSGDGATRADSSGVIFVFFEFFEIFYPRSPPAPLHFHLTSFQIGRKGKGTYQVPPPLLSPLTLPSFERQGGEVETEAPGQIPVELLLHFLHFL